MSVRINQEPVLIGTNGSGNTRVNQLSQLVAINVTNAVTGNTRINQMAMLLFVPTNINYIPIPANPNEQPKTVPSVDISNVDSRTAAGLESWFAPIPPQPAVGGIDITKTTQPYVIATGHPVVTRADGALWDIVAGQYVTIDQTTLGTGRSSKNGQ